MLLGQVVPDFAAETTEGKINFHQWLAKDDKWTVFFSHPADFTPVCTTELAAVQAIIPDLLARNVKPIALSCNDVDAHKSFVRDIKAYGNLSAFSYPIIADANRDVANLYGMMDPLEKDAAGLPLTCRAAFVIGPDKKLKLSFLYPATTGRNTAELLRVIDSLQLTVEKKVATPVNWNKGDDVLVLPTLKDEEAKKLFPKGFKTIDLPSGKGYLRITPHPQ